MIACTVYEFMACYGMPWYYFLAHKLLSDYEVFSIFPSQLYRQKSILHPSHYIQLSRHSINKTYNIFKMHIKPQAQREKYN